MNMSWAGLANHKILSRKLILKGDWLGGRWHRLISDTSLRRPPGPPGPRDAYKTAQGRLRDGPGRIQDGPGDAYKTDQGRLQDGLGRLQDGPATLTRRPGDAYKTAQADETALDAYKTVPGTLATRPRVAYKTARDANKTAR